MKNILLYFSLLASPLLFLVIEYFKLPLLPHYYSTNPDPSYIYLMNGLNIASGNWELGHYDNPGTPLHLLTGCIIYFTHLLNGRDEIITDVLSRPEYYISVCIRVLVILKAISVLVIGFQVAKATKSLLWGLTFQLIPFFIIHRLECPALLHPDLLLDSGFILLIAFSFPFIISPASSVNTFKHNFLSYWPVALTAGLIAATKFSSVGIIVFLLAIVSGIRNKLFFLIQCICFFYLFTLPVFSRLDEFWNFITGILVHKGKYGQGEAGIVETYSFFENIKLIYKKEFTLIITVFISVILILYSYIIKKKNHMAIIAGGILLTIAFETIIIGKHFSYHYTLPMHYLFIPALFILVYYIHNQTGLIKNISNTLRIAAFAGIAFIAGFRVYGGNVFSPYFSSSMIETDVKIKEAEVYPVIYFFGEDTIFLTSSSTYPALWFGKVYSGYHTRWDRAKKLEDIYPQKFFYSALFNSFENWNEPVPLWKVFADNSKVYLYEREKNLHPAIEVIKHRLTEYGIDSAITIHPWFKNTSSGEMIYELTADTALIKQKWKKYKQITFDFNRVYLNKFTSTDSLTTSATVQYFKNDPEGMNNTNCLGIAKKDPVLLSTFRVYKGNYISASIWRKAPDNKNYIELRAANGFYHHTGYVSKKKNDWEKITINYEVPANFPDSIYITLRNALKHEILYDDLNIEIWDGQKN